MLFLKADSGNLARVDAPKASIWSKFSNISKTTKVAMGVFATGVAVAASAISFGAIPLIAGGVVALAGAGIYAYGKISQAIERKSYVKPILKAPAKDFDFMYIAPQHFKKDAPGAPVSAPVQEVSKNVAAPVANVKKTVVANSGKENRPASSQKNADVSMIFPNRPVTLGHKVATQVTVQSASKLRVIKPLTNSNRPQILA